MLQTWIHRVRPGMEARLQDWLSELTWRAEEVRESLRASGIRAEQAFMVPGDGGSLLVYVSEADDQVFAAQVFASSSLPIDEQHRQVMRECVEETLNLAPSYEVTA